MIIRPTANCRNLLLLYFFSISGKQAFQPVKRSKITRQSYELKMKHATATIE